MEEKQSKFAASVYFHIRKKKKRCLGRALLQTSKKKIDSYELIFDDLLKKTLKNLAFSLLT